MLRLIIKNKEGTSLIEMMLTLAIFTAIMLAATGIFQMSIEGQRVAIAGQNIQESMRYAMEVISKEIRMAQRANFDCNNQDDDVYHKQGERLQLKNYSDQCVEYAGQADSFLIDRDGANDSITPNDIIISDLFFIMSDDWESGLTQQSKVTFRMLAAPKTGKYRSPVILQTTISSRYYE